MVRRVSSAPSRRRCSSSLRPAAASRGRPRAAPRRRPRAPPRGRSGGRRPGSPCPPSRWGFSPGRRRTAVARQCWSGKGRPVRRAVQQRPQPLVGRQAAVAHLPPATTRGTTRLPTAATPPPLPRAPRRGPRRGRRRTRGGPSGGGRSSHHHVAPQRRGGREQRPPRGELGGVVGLGRRPPHHRRRRRHRVRAAAAAAEALAAPRPDTPILRGATRDSIAAAATSSAYAEPAPTRRARPRAPWRAALGGAPAVLSEVPGAGGVAIHEHCACAARPCVRSP